VLKWEIVATIAEVTGAIGVIASLLYVAKQVKAAQSTAADTNRLTRANGVREMFQTLAGDADLGNAVVRTYGLESYYEEMAAQFGVSTEDAMRSDFHNAYYFWLHWGQFSSTTDENDLDELAHVIHSYSTPALNYSWTNSIWAKPALDPKFVEFVDDVLANYHGNFMKGE